jgi:hypothetical protein
MSTIVIHRRIDSETLHLPEIRPLIGKTVEIVVREEPTAAVGKTAEWDAAMQAARELTSYDFDAVRDQYDNDRHHAADPLLGSS